MKLSQTELVVVGLLIAYIAFFTHPPPSHIKDFLSSPVGHAVFLLGIVYLTVYKSLIIGIFAGIAYVMTAASTTEYLKADEQKPKASTPSTSSLKDILGKLEKGDTLAHKAVAGKTVTAPPPSVKSPVGASSSSTTTKTSTPV
jgi:hypothetical protein